MKVLPLVVSVTAVFLAVVVQRKNEAFGASIERSSDWNGETGIDSPINPMELAFPAFQRLKRTPDGCCSCGDHHCCGSMCHGK